MYAYRTQLCCAHKIKRSIYPPLRDGSIVSGITAVFCSSTCADHYGVTQVIADADSPVFNQVEAVRSEWCIRIDGNVLARDESLINPKLPLAK